MTTDDRISEDLAIVARTSGALRRPIESTLAAVGAIATPPPPPTTLSGVALLQLSRIFVARVTRAAIGAAAAVIAIAFSIYLGIPYKWPDNPSVIHELMYGPKLVVVCMAGAIVLPVHVAASRYAARAFERVVHRDPHALVVRWERWSVAAAIAGTVVLVLFVAMMQAVLGSDRLISIHEGKGMVKVLTFGSLWTAMAAVFAGSAVVAWVVRRPHTWMIPVGIIILFVTVIAWLRFDVGPILVNHVARMPPSVPLRASLTATGTIGIFLVVTGIVLGIRRREQALLAR